jgi:hypothetical protein
MNIILNDPNYIIINQFSNISSNLTNLVDLENSSTCNQPQIFSNLNDFLICYNYFASMHLFKTIFGLLLIIGTIVFNSLILIFRMIGSLKIKVFDQILVGNNYLIIIFD